VRFKRWHRHREDIRVEGPATRLTLTGTASVPAREYDLKGVASLTSAAAGGDKGFELPFVVQGPWTIRLVFPDPESLIRRSPGAAPLLDAVKDRKTRGRRAFGDRAVYGRGARPPETAAPAPANAPAGLQRRTRP